MSSLPDAATVASTAGSSDSSAPHAPLPARAGFTGTDVMLLAMATIWGVNYSFIKFALGVFPPLTFNALRVVLATTALACIAFAPGARRPSAQDARRLMLLGLLGHAAYQMLFISGLARARAGTVALVIGWSPALIAILGYAFGFDRISRTAVIGVGISILGVVFVVIGTSSAPAGEDSLLGIALILTSSTCWAFYTMGLRTLTDRVDGVQIAAWTLFGGAVPLVLVGLPGLVRMDLAAVTPAAWGAVLFSGLMAFVLAYLFWYRGVQRVGPTRTSMYANLQPVIALAAAWITLGEVPSSWQFAGGACVITGVLLSRV